MSHRPDGGPYDDHAGCVPPGQAMTVPPPLRDEGLFDRLPAAPRIDTTVPHSARIWNYWLGGKDHYPVDRQAGDRYREIFPGIVDTAWGIRHFMARSVRYLAGEAGVRQFLDIGTGLPTVDNTHEVAQAAAPDSRIVYVDNDPLVLAHARALLTSNARGACDYVDADMHTPEAVWSAAARTLDFRNPVAVLFLGVLGHVQDDSEAQAVVTAITGKLASGSYLVIADSIDEGDSHRAAQKNYTQTGAVPYRLRNAGQIQGYFTGLRLVDPGLVDVNSWRPDPSPDDKPKPVLTLGGVAVK